MTFRPGGPGKRNSWQATCACPGHSYKDGRKTVRCTRSRTHTHDGTGPESDDAKKVLDVLKAWLSKGSTVATKAAHTAMPDEEGDDDQPRAKKKRHQ